MGILYQILTKKLIHKRYIMDNIMCLFALQTAIESSLSYI